ncbi:MAG: hypothetical protein A2Y40_09695 [Candidatus Margulisbacteria bacterium GWF2_35_9]|nr:MAG: hypothetical protein A2Y40_09695 [Candidatus Margulisbacteria bacterium GWF2_35_9]
MLVNSIELINFRNYSSRKFQFNNNLNLIIGNNGQGKSNLIEAIQFLSISKSIKTNISLELIKSGCIESSIIAEITDDDSFKNSIHIKFNNRGKQIILNNKLLIKSSDLLKTFNTVYISEEDINIVSGSPVERRRFLDGFLTKTDFEYMDNLKQFKQIIKQKSKLLKEEKINRDILVLYNTKLIGINKIIIKKRRKFLEYVKENIQNYLENKFHHIKNKKVEIIYTNTLNNENDEKEMVNKEIKYRECLYGAHRDDFSINFQEKNVKKYMSLGQKRLISFILKLSEKDYLIKYKKINPVILVDDAFNGLDDQTIKITEELLQDSLQKIVTTTNKNKLFSNINSEINEIEIKENATI